MALNGGKQLEVLQYFNQRFHFNRQNKKPSVFVSTYEEGIKRVLEGNYAFLMESTMLDYNVQRDCNLTQIGGLLDTKGFCYSDVLTIKINFIFVLLFTNCWLTNRIRHRNTKRKHLA